MSTSAAQQLHSANRAVHREQMDRFGGELGLLNDSEAVGEEALGKYADGSLQEQCFGVATSVLLDIQEWATGSQSKLDWAGIFDKYPMPNADRVQVRDRVRLNPMLAYAPGVLAMSEMVAVAPYVAARGGVPKTKWGAVAADTREFGAQLSRNGTDLQTLIRQYLHSDEKSEVIPGLSFLDPAKLKLDDETGITTVTPVDDMIAATLEALTKRTHPDQDDVAGMCVALQAKAPEGCEHARTMFDAVWIAYASVVNRLVYPTLRSQEMTYLLRRNRLLILRRRLTRASTV